MLLFLEVGRPFCVVFYLMERIDEGHLDPKLEVPRLTCLGRPAIEPGPPR